MGLGTIGRSVRCKDYEKPLQNRIVPGRAQVLLTAGIYSFTQSPGGRADMQPKRKSQLCFHSHQSALGIFITSAPSVQAHAVAIRKWVNLRKKGGLTGLAVWCIYASARVDVLSVARS